MEWRGRGIVLNTHVQGEADLMVVLFTRDKGKVRALAKSAMKSKRRFVGQLLPCNHIEATLAVPRRSQLLRLERSSLINSFPAIRRDIMRVAAASCLAEMVEMAAPEAEPSPRIYEMLLKALEEIQNGKEPDRIRLIYELKILSLLGFRPSLEDCAHCGKKLPERSLSFSAKAGGVLCKACTKSAGDAQRISPAAAKSMRLALLLPDGKINRLGFTKSALKESLYFMETFTLYYLHRPLKSRLFINKIKSGPKY